MTERVALERRLSEAIGAADADIRERLEREPGAYLDLVRLTAAADDCVAGLLEGAVWSARRAGHSWQAVGRALGMTRQGAQQRFGGAPGPEASSPAERRVLTPVTAFDEMRILDDAGRYGWHSVGYGVRHHVVEKSTRQWEHRRVRLWGREAQRLESAGWQRIGTSWFPWAYYARATDRPALVPQADPTGTFKSEARLARIPPKS